MSISGRRNPWWSHDSQIHGGDFRAGSEWHASLSVVRCSRRRRRLHHCRHHLPGAAGSAAGRPIRQGGNNRSPNHQSHL